MSTAPKNDRPMHTTRRDQLTELVTTIDRLEIFTNQLFPEQPHELKEEMEPGTDFTSTMDWIGRTLLEQRDRLTRIADALDTAMG